MLFNNDDPCTDVHRILRPVHNSGVLFEISRRLPACGDSDSLLRERFTLVMYHSSAPLRDDFVRERACQHSSED